MGHGTVGGGGIMKNRTELLTTWGKPKNVEVVFELAGKGLDVVGPRTVVVDRLALLEPTLTQ